MRSPREQGGPSAQHNQTPRPPLVLIVNDQEWSTRSLESILWPNGYAVLRAYTGIKALERARSAQPDLIIIDSNLSDVDSCELCVQLRHSLTLRDSTPILMTSPVRPSRATRLAALRAGAWDFISYPLDAEELLLKLGGFVRAKLDADRARDGALLDTRTGLYNIRGLERRARELGSHAFRHHWPVACVVVSPDPLSDDVANGAERVATACKHVLRTSDAVARVSDSEFVVIAPGTDAPGAIRLAERLSNAVGEKNGLRAGYQAVSDYHEHPIELMDMVAHATDALHAGRADQGPGHHWIRMFDTKRN